MCKITHFDATSKALSKKWRCFCYYDTLPLLPENLCNYPFFLKNSTH